jgi:hypothetical protein
MPPSRRIAAGPSEYRSGVSGGNPFRTAVDDE